MTVSALVCINHATYGGVYYCASFTTSGAITWTKLTTTGLPSTEITHFRVDYGDPLNRQYVKIGNEIYTRTTGNWSKILDLTIAAAAVSGATKAAYEISWLYTDPTTPGSVYSLFLTDPNDPGPQSGEVYVLKSLDYGANWTGSAQIYNTSSRTLAVEAIGDDIWCSYGKLIIASSFISYSSDGGATWNRQLATAGSSGTANLRINPHAPNKVYAWGDGDHNEWSYASGFTDRNIPFEAAGGRSDNCWFDPVVENRVVYKAGANNLYSVDNFGSYASTTTTENNPAGVTGPNNVIGSTELLASLYALPEQTLSYYTSPTDAAGDERGGANTGTPPYTDSIPNVASLSMYGVWWGAPPADSGVFVYADELGDITDVPTYTGLGKPLFGTQASFRDRNADGFDIFHAEDVHRNERELHTPQPTGNDGWGIIETGGYWVSSGEPIALESDLHDPVTLDADADAVLDITGQEIGLDEQNANTVFAGPATGAANEPTFRALVAADLGTGAPDGTKYLRDDLTWQTISTAINVHTVTTITADTTLDDTYDVVIVDATSNDVTVNLPATSANDGLTFFIKRIDDSANDVTVVPVVTVLLDSDGIPMTDSGGSPLYDSGGSGTNNYIDGEMSQALGQYDAIQIVADKDAGEWWII